MKRCIASALVLLALTSGVARAGGISLGAFAGMSYPVLQEDAGKGTLIGVRAPVRLVPFVVVEPFWGSTKLGDKVTTVADVSYTREGFDETAYGANVMFAMGGPLSFYPVVGVGRTTLKRPGFEQSFTTYDGGLGLRVAPIPKFGIDLRAEMQAIVDGETTRKFGNFTAGLSYSLFGLP